VGGKKKGGKEKKGSREGPRESHLGVNAVGLGDGDWTGKFTKSERSGMLAEHSVGGAG